MSWSFYGKGSPSEVKAQAEKYFGGEYVANMTQPERSISQLVHAQIVLAAETMPDDFLLNVTAYGSQSIYSDGKRINQLSVSFSTEVAPAKEVTHG